MSFNDSVLAALSAAVYQQSRNDANLTPVPPGWTQLTHTHDFLSGFEASAYTDGDHVVISCAGTQIGPADITTDIDIGLGLSDSQLFQAAEFYEQVKQANPGADITFTGHSLGGGLAALMNIFFDKQAVTFDSAPFRLSATQSFANGMQQYLQAQGFPPDADLAGYTTTESLLLQARPDLAGAVAAIGLINSGLGAHLLAAMYPTEIPREANVTAIATGGELLSAANILLTADQLDSIAEERIRNEASDLDVDVIENLATDLRKLVGTAGLAQGVKKYTDALSLAATEYYYYCRPSWPRLCVSCFR
jgi:hypothetical protein